jgi:hypothetical protein
LAIPRSGIAWEFAPQTPRGYPHGQPRLLCFSCRYVCRRLKHGNSVLFTYEKSQQKRWKKLFLSVVVEPLVRQKLKFLDKFIRNVWFNTPELAPRRLIVYAAA